MDQMQLLNEVVGEGYDVIISGVFAEPFGEDWLGRKINAAMLSELEAMAERHGINPSGEGGEIETTVLDAPFFKKRIVIEEGEKEYHRDSGILRIKKASLVKK
jgi:uncharacterized protein (TIGR00290 family)